MIHGTYCFVNKKKEEESNLFDFFQCSNVLICVLISNLFTKQGKGHMIRVFHFLGIYFSFASRNILYFGNYSQNL